METGNRQEVFKATIDLQGFTKRSSSKDIACRNANGDGQSSKSIQDNHQSANFSDE